MVRSDLGLILIVSLLGLLLAPPTMADTQIQRINEHTYQQLTRAQTLMERERYEEALAQLDSLRPRVERRPRELALVLQAYGHLYASEARYRQAITALTECIALQALPKAATARSLYVLIQLYMMVGDDRAAVTTLQRWFEVEPEPTPAGRALAGMAYARVERYPEAAEQLQMAIGQASRPEEGWYRQLYAVHYRAGQYQAAAELLQEMITQFPARKDYWLQLAGVYAEMDGRTQSVAVLELAYLQGLLSEQDDLVNLARHYLYAGLPHKAGDLLERALRDGALQPTVENWALLIDAWLHARERSRALAAVEQALEVVEHVELHLKHAQLLADEGSWAKVVPAVEFALSGGTLEAPGKAHLLAGMAQYHLERPRDAQSHFERAREFEHSRQQAEQWLQYLAAMRMRAGR